MDQLFNHYADFTALEAEKSKVINIFREIEDQIVRLSKLGFKLDSANGMKETNAAAKELANTTAKLEALNEKYATAQLRQQKLQSEIDLKAAQAAKVRKKEEAARNKALIDQERHLERIAAAEAKRNKGANPIVDFSPNNTNVDVPFNNNGLDNTINDAQRAEAELVMTTNEWAASMDTAAGAAENLNASTKAGAGNLAANISDIDQYTGTLEANLIAQEENAIGIQQNKAAQKALALEIKNAGSASEVQIAQMAALKEEGLLLNETNKQLAITTRNQAKLFISEGGSIEELLAKVALLQQQYELLGKAEQNSKFGIEMKGQIDKLEPALKKMEADLGKSQRNVGNYGGAVGKAASTAFGFLRQVAYIVPGIGIAGILGAISETVIDLVSSLFKGSKALNTFAIQYKDYTDVIKSANVDAGKQIADLKILYSAATNVALSTTQRAEAVKALKKEFPDYFKNLSDETIMNGDAKKSYDELTLSIIASSRAKAAKEKIDALEGERLDALEQKQKIILATGREADRVRPVSGKNFLGEKVLSDLTIQQKLAYDLNTITQRRNKALDEQEKKLKLINDREKFLVDLVGVKDITKTTTDTVLGKDKTKTPDDLDKRLAEERKAAYELNKIRLQAEIDKNKAFADIDELGVAKQTEFRKAQLHAELELVKATQAEEIAVIEDRVKTENKNATKDQAAATTRAAALQQVKVVEETTKKIVELQVKADSDILQYHTDYIRLTDQQSKAENDRVIREEATALNERLQINKKFYDSLTLQNAETTSNAKISLAEQYEADIKLAGDNSKKKEELTRKYNTDLQKINDDFERNALSNTIDFYQTQVNELKEKGEDTKEAEEALAKARLAIQQKHTDKVVEAANTEKQLLDELDNSYKNLAKGVEDAFSNVISGVFDKRKNQLQEEIDLIDKTKEADINRINSSAESEEKKAARIKIIEAKAQADKEVLERRQRKLDTQRAIFERGFKAFEIVTDGIQSVGKIKLMVAELIAKSAANPYLAPLIPVAAAQIPISIALSAANLVALLATPIPKYARGSTGTPAGLGIAGEAGRELAVDPKGNVNLFEKATLTNFAKGTRIFPNAVTERILSTRKPLWTRTTTEAKDTTGEEIVGELKQLNKKSANRIIIHNDGNIETTAWYWNNMKY